MTIQTPCWSDKEVIKILKPDAEEIADHIFRAVHYSSELNVADSVTAGRISISPDQLISKFLDPNRDFVQTVVLGDSGTGKSHLIQWLRLNIPQDESTVLLTIPKTGTSLRGIVEKLISRLPAGDQIEYKQRLSSTGTQIATQDAKVSKFLDSLAWAVEFGGLASKDDIDLSTLLPDVLRDPIFRKGFFLSSESTVNAIVQHIFDDPQLRDTSDDRREFSLGDLPLDGARYNDASLPAKEAIDYIKGESGMDSRAIGLMNLNLDLAIAQTLNFSADNLIDLMNSLRRHLYIQGKKLILLIEDFARLQGIDTALLQALITPPGQGEDRLCELRWAMAVTTGYFRRLEQTVQGRTTFLVDMDLNVPASLSRWTAGYLNALRIGDSTLKKLQNSSKIQSHCTECTKKQSCFTAFGEVDGIGLYPFTEKAIKIMSQRSESSFADETFNPRKYLRKVLDPVLYTHYQDLETGQFPSNELLKRIGGANLLTPVNRLEIEKKDPINYERRTTLLELWDGSSKIVNLPEGIHESFGIPSLKDVNSSSTIVEPVGTKPEPELGLVPADVEAIRRWAVDNSMLSQKIVTELRTIIFNALESYIDWDRLGFKKAFVTSSTGTISVAFKQISINFTNQQTQIGNSLVMLNLDIDNAIALEALLMNKYKGGWDFEGGAKLYSILLEKINSWSIEIENKLNALYKPANNWDPLAASVELLIIATFQSGRVKLDDDLETLISNMWEANSPNALSCLDPSFAELNKRLIKSWDNLLILLKNLSSGTKGGVAGNFVRISPILETVRSLKRRSLVLTQTPPEEFSSKELRDLGELYLLIKNSFSDRLSSEKEAWNLWLQTINEHFSEQDTFESVINELKVLMERVIDKGIIAGNSRSRLQESMATMTPALFDRTFSHVKSLITSNPNDFLIRLSIIGDKKGSLDNIIRNADDFISTVDISIENYRTTLTGLGGEGLLESEELIESQLSQLLNSLDTLSQIGGAENELN
jgi:hypothetical protein